MHVLLSSEVIPHANIFTLLKLQVQGSWVFLYVVVMVMPLTLIHIEYFNSSFDSITFPVKRHFISQQVECSVTKCYIAVLNCDIILCTTLSSTNKAITKRSHPLIPLSFLTTGGKSITWDYFLVGNLLIKITTDSRN